MWQSWSNGEHTDLIFDSLCNHLSREAIRFSIRKSAERGDEYIFTGLFNLGCGEYHYILSLYSNGPYWHAYSLAGFSLNGYERQEGLEMLKLLITFLPDDLKSVANSAANPRELLGMLSNAKHYPMEFYLTD